jgi:hypothetical protein
MRGRENPVAGKKEIFFCGCAYFAISDALLSQRRSTDGVLTWRCREKKKDGFYLLGARCTDGAHRPVTDSTPFSVSEGRPLQSMRFFHVWAGVST